jgi:hypothetical protein
MVNLFSFGILKETTMRYYSNQRNDIGEQPCNFSNLLNTSPKFVEINKNLTKLVPKPRFHLDSAML